MTVSLRVRLADLTGRSGRSGDLRVRLYSPTGHTPRGRVVNIRGGQCRSTNPAEAVKSAKRAPTSKRSEP